MILSVPLTSTIDHVCRAYNKYSRNGVSRHLSGKLLDLLDAARPAGVYSKDRGHAGHIWAASK